MKASLFLFSIILLIGCSNRKKKFKIIYNKDGYYEVGYCSPDSIFHGKVDRYSLVNDTFLGYSNYYHGTLNGISINKYPNGATKDSINMALGNRDGESFQFDSNGNVVYQINYLGDRHVGSQITFNSNKQITNYSFENFEGKTLFSLDYNNKDTIENGKLLNYQIDTIIVDDLKKVHLFLYLIKIPDLKMQYEILKMEKKKVLSSQKIIEKNCFYETWLDTLPNNQQYAIGISIFNKAKGKNDLSIYFL